MSTTVLHEVNQPVRTGDHDADMATLSQWAFDVLRDAGYPVVLATVHGSHLYGTYHEGSDLDLYAVVTGTLGAHGPRPRGLHVVADGLDVTVLELDTHLASLNSGAHQALEAHGSPWLVLDPAWAPFLLAHHPSPYKVVAKARSSNENVLSRAATMPEGKALRRAFTQGRNAWSYYRHGHPFAHNRATRLHSPRPSA